MISGGLWIVLVLGAVPGFAELLEMVDVPVSLRGKMCSMALVDIFVTVGVERVLKNLFPTPLPPEKGYMIHSKQLKVLSDKKQS